MFHFIFLLVGSNMTNMPNVSFLEGVILTISVVGREMKIKAKLSSISTEISNWS